MELTGTLHVTRNLLHVSFGEESDRELKESAKMSFIPIKASPFFAPDLSSDDKSHGRSKRVLAAILNTTVDGSRPGNLLVEGKEHWTGHQDCGWRMAD